MASSNCIDPDHFLDLSGALTITRTEGLEAWEKAYALLEQRLTELGSSATLYLVFGIQAGGKTTWVSKNAPLRGPKAIFFSGPLPSRRHRVRALELAKRFRCRAVAVWINVPLEVAVARNSQRSGLLRVPEKTILHGASLNSADLEGADLQHGDFVRAKLFQTNLVRANLRGANLRSAFLAKAKLDDADLGNATLHASNLQGASLRRANLEHTIIARCDVRGADFRKAIFGGTTLSQTKLSQARHLETAVHSRASSLGAEILLASGPKLPNEFLRGCGVEDDVLAMVATHRLGEVESYYSVFISYSHKDSVFAANLHDRLQIVGVRCWLDERRMRPGDDIYEEVDQGIREQDRILLCASEHSLSSWWVDTEIDSAFAKERELMRLTKQRSPVLIPIDLDGYMFSERWKSGKRLLVQSRLAANFTDPSKFEDEFQRLREALVRQEAKR